MLDEKELTQVREYVIKILPDLLRSDPAIATTIEGILAQQFPRRDEFARLLDEVRDFRQETDQRFEQVDQRFEQVDQRFEQIDQRFEQVDQRFEQVDQRFEQVTGRLDNLEKGQLGLRRDMAKLQSSQESLLHRMTGVEAWSRFITGTVRNQKGESLESAVAAGLRYGFSNPDIQPEQILLRQKIADREGLIYPFPYESEVDIIASNGELIVFEVKSTGRADEVWHFAMKVRLLAAQNPDKQVRGVFIAPEAGPDIQEQCERFGVELLDWPGFESKP